MQFSDYIVFVDESGDHGMDSIDEGYPLFVLSCCLISKRDYMATVVPAMQQLKFATFGHDAVVLHEREIRKDQGPFAIFRTPGRKARFLQALTDVLARTPMTVFSTVIDKRLLSAHGRRSENPYESSLRFCLERIFDDLQRLGQTELHGSPLMTHVLCECRGRKEDSELELAFRRICDGDNAQHARLPFDPVLVDKKSNAIGLQLADLVARPIGLHVLRPGQPNRAWDVIETKLGRRGDGHYPGHGLKCFP